MDKDYTLKVNKIQVFTDGLPSQWEARRLRQSLVHGVPLIQCIGYDLERI